MVLSKMTVWELSQIFKGKKFAYAFIVQFFVILAIIPLFDVYSEILEDPREIVLPTSQGFIPVAVSSSPLEEILDDQPLFRIYRTTPEEAFTLLKTHAVCCFISGETIIYDEDNPKARVAEFHLQRLLQEEPSLTISFNLREKSVVPRQQIVARELAMREIRRTAEMMQSSQLSYSTLLVLLMAIFLASGILVDLILSEKEKQTGEVLLSLPVHPWQILLSKVAAVVIVLVSQIALWILTLYVLGRVSSLFSMIPLFLVSFLIISLTCLVSVYSKSYKEAGFAITVSYVLLFAFFMSASAFYVFSERFSYLSPLSMIIMIEKGDYSLLEMMYAALPTFVVSCSLIFISIGMYGRDEFYFGPRPSFFNLIRLFSLRSVLLGILLILVVAAVYAHSSLAAFFFGGG